MALEQPMSPGHSYQMLALGCARAVGGITGWNQHFQGTGMA